MVSRRAVALLVILAVAALMPFFSDADTAGDATAFADNDVTVYGYVANLSDQERNGPLPDVNVTLYLATGTSLTSIGSTVTDSEGRFEFTFAYDSEADYCLFFDYSGYTVRSLPDIRLTLDEEGYVHFTLDDSMRPDAADEPYVYALTGDAYGSHAIGMVVTTGIIYGTVTGDDSGKTFPLGGATVTVVSSEGMSYSTVTNGSGYFSIECPYGIYTLTAWCNGFSGSEAVMAESGAMTSYTVVLKQNSPTQFLGMDIAHATLVMGLLILALFILATMALHHRISKKDAEPILLNDLADLEKTDEDEVRHP